MLALLNGHSHDELFLPSGSTVAIPHCVIEPCSSASDLDAAVRYAFKAGLIPHSEFLAARDALLPDDTVI